MQIFAPSAQVRLGRELTQSEYQKFRRAFEKAFDEVLPKEALEMPMANVFADHFDSNELKDILKFHRTPVGLKVLRAEGVIVQEFQRVMVKLMEGKKEEFEKVLGREFDSAFEK